MLDLYGPGTQLGDAIAIATTTHDARSRKRLRWGVAKFLRFCRETGADPGTADMTMVNGPYREWLVQVGVKGWVEALVYARRLARELALSGEPPSSPAKR